jgi:hypothetical protein
MPPDGQGRGDARPSSGVGNKTNLRYDVPQVFPRIFSVRLRGDDPIYAKIDALAAQLKALQATLNTVQTGESTMAADLSGIQSQVAANTNVIQSAITLLNGLAAQLQAAKNDPVAIQSIIDKMTADDNALAQAVAANTPAAPAA